MEKKITKKERFMELKEIVANRPELVEFLDHEIELLNKKANTKTPSKTQIENEGLKNVIVNVLTNATEPMTITDITNANEQLVGLSNQKISALLIQLIGANLVVRTSDKKKAYFSIVR
jgi:nitrogen fixation/metabolism regulation signal transduction histidine kinase